MIFLDPSLHPDVDYCALSQLFRDQITHQVQVGEDPKSGSSRFTVCP